MIESIFSKKCFIYDIEGTVAPISFVHSVLFPYSSANLESFLNQNGVPEKVKETLIQENGLDVKSGFYSDALDSVENIHSVINYLQFLIRVDRKSPSLKEIQGLIWENGYRKSEIKSSLYSDAPVFMEKVVGLGKKNYIYSSGSILAQKLIFEFSEQGNLTNWISDYFDTGVGPKKESSSYQNILKSISADSEDCVFFTDIVDEARAAKSAGIESYILNRPGNFDQGIHEFPVINQFPVV